MDRVLFSELAEEHGFKIDAEAMERFALYSKMLVHANETMNLTAITDDKGISSKHFADSLLALPMLPEGAFSMIDVGTGAGFPGIPIAIMRKDVRLTLLDSLNKRLSFLNEVCHALEIGLTLVHARAEDAGRNAEHRERYDVSIARAVAKLPALCEYCMPFVKVGGRFIAMKGPDGLTELETAHHAVECLGSGRDNVKYRVEKLRDGEGGIIERCLIKVDKKISTPVKYPRSPSKIKEMPL